PKALHYTWSHALADRTIAVGGCICVAKDDWLYWLTETTGTLNNRPGVEKVGNFSHKMTEAIGVGRTAPAIGRLCRSTNRTPDGIGLPESTRVAAYRISTPKF